MTWKQVNTRVISNEYYWKTLKELNPSKAQSLLNHFFTCTVVGSSHPWEVNDEIVEWLQTHTKGMAYVERESNTIRVFMELEEDAMLFKLTWVEMANV